MAAHWAARLDSGPLSAEDRAALDAWRAGDPRRVGALARAIAVSALFDDLARRDNRDPARPAVRRPRA